MNVDALPDRLRQCIVVDDAGCWLWSGKLSSGYGRLAWHGRRDQRAHRVTYELLVGPIPSGLEIDHLCRVRHCVNPAHLEPVTHRENLLRGDTIAASNAAKTHCPQGHPLVEGNLEISHPGRTCKLCHRSRIYAARKLKRARLRNQNRSRR